MKTVCIYHSIDLDGWMSAAIVKHWFLLQNVNGLSNYFVFNRDLTNNPYGNLSAETLDMIGYNYGDPIPDLSKYDKVIMCDVSFPKEEMSRLWHNLDLELIWIDHHISAINDNRDLVWLHKGLQDTNFAASELTWKYFFPNKPMPEIVRLLGRYDCFGHKGTEEELKVMEFQYGARQLIDNYEDAYTWLLRNLDESKLPNVWGTIDTILNRGRSIYKYLCKEAKQIYKKGFEVLFNTAHLKIGDRFTTKFDTDTYKVTHITPNLKMDGGCCYYSGEGYVKSSDINEISEGADDNVRFYNFICINRDRFNPSSLGIDYHADGYDGAACFSYKGDTKVWAFSLYNENGLVDCSQIAKQYGGGGHKGAAGFVVNDLSIIIK